MGSHDCPAHGAGACLNAQIDWDWASEPEEDATVRRPFEDVSELLVVSVAWSLLAVEAALRDRLGADDKSPLKALLTLAGKHLLLSREDIDRLEAGRVLRNRLTHPRNQQAWSVGMAAPVVAASHHAVTLISPTPSDKARSPSGRRRGEQVPYRCLSMGLDDATTLETVAGGAARLRRRRGPPYGAAGAARSGRSCWRSG